MTDPPRLSIVAALTVVMLLTLPATAQLSADTNDFTYSTADLGWAQLMPPTSDGNDWFIDNSETHGDVVCTKDGDGLLQCGVAPTFGECPDGYLKAEYSNGWPTTCWAPSADSDPGIIITIGDLAPDSPRSFNRLETSTSNPARTGTLMAEARIPDAPSAARPPSVADRPHVSAGCGPAWLGGCWRFPNRPLADVARDPHWWAFSVGLTAATAFDYTMTAVGLSHGRCGERNPAIGQHPGAGTFAADFATTHLPVIIGGLVIGKVLPRHGPAAWIYPAMASYGVQLHVRGGLSWLQGGCW